MTDPDHTANGPDHRAWTDAQAETTVEVDGHEVSMAYYDEGEGHPVVFLHGIPTWSFLWRRIAPPLADDVRTIVPDLVGYGNSDRRDGFDRSIRAQELAVADLIDGLGLETVSLVAHDIGGGVALRYAAHEPDRVERLVLSNAVCYDSWPVEFVTTMGLPRTAEMAPDEFEAKLDFAFADGLHGDDADPEWLDGMKAPWLAEGGRRALARAAVATNTNHTTEIDYDAIDADVLCLWGADDRMQPLSYGERLAADLGGEVVELERAYHWVVEDRPEAYLEACREFLG
ncbi:alpha/beta fold hydrolase [Halomarina pelagica]|uniref:alpha/beta fold hydrolase n=1 Tax=Halomarina pelagica TaxID=2961599 RepID=UPI0020C2587C|nr:alpha/beta fold hydrolase [Halomarina sp. BND7]